MRCYVRRLGSTGNNQNNNGEETEDSEIER
jgi:hypothetical protein